VGVIAFDVNGTLLDPGDQADRLQQAVRLAMAHTLAGDFRPFAELLEAAGSSVPESMPPYPDVPDALRRLRGDGHRLAAITNSARETAEAHLDRAGLGGLFERVVGTDEVAAYKPAPQVYLHALAELAVEADDTWFVAAHDWDIVGAHAVGLRTAFVDRGGPPPVTVATAQRLSSLDELRP
jgi:HAD superfamily hydrolase (TIGR01509 family)